MKTISGECESSKEISLSKATKIISKFVSADNGVSHVINAYLQRASVAFNELNQLHKDLKLSSLSHRKSRRSHTTGDSGRLEGNSVRFVDLKSENEFDDVKLSQELNGFVVGGSEKLKKDKKKKKIEFGDREGDGRIPKQNEIESGKSDEGGIEEGKKQKKEKKKKDENVEVENAKGEQKHVGIEKKISNSAKVENGELVDARDIEIRSKKKNEAGSEKVRMQKEKNVEGENAKTHNHKEIDKKLSNGVKSENGGIVGSQDLEIKSKKKHEAGIEKKLHVEEVKTEKRKKRKNEDVEEKIEDRSGEPSKKKRKKKLEDNA